jgi:SAM-dependent methyltransferase
MRWIWKVMAFKVLGQMPGGEAIHYFLQKNITQSVVATDEAVLQRTRVGIEYLDFMGQFLNIEDFSGMTHVDIGAGWMPMIPLLFYSAGFERQLLCDIRRNLRPEIVADVISTFRRVASHEKDLEIRCRRLPPPIDPRDTLERYLARLGIRYVAPYGLHDLLEEKGFKFITCTQVLPCLNKEQLRSLLRIIASALKGGGIFVAAIHLYDLYSSFDKTISPYNKWKYSDLLCEWLINSKMMSINHLTASEYRQLFEESGLEIVEFRVAEPTISDLQELRRIKVHKQFSHVPERELAAKDLFLAAKHGGTDANFPGVSQNPRSS